MSGTVFLVRHGSHAEVGHVLSGRSDIALSDAGRTEVARLAEHLSGAAIAAIHASPRRRARETAEIIAERHDLPVQRVDALDEIDFGAWSGKRFDALSADAGWQRWNSQRGSASTPAGETMAHVISRAVRHLENHKENGTVLCVSHCDVIRGIVVHYLGMQADRMLAFDCDPASLTRLELADGIGRVMSLNERPA